MNRPVHRPRPATLYSHVARRYSLLVLTTLLVAGSAIGSEATDAPRVLVLHAETTQLPATQLMDQGFRAALRGQPAGEPRVYEEYLDARRFPGLARDPELARWLAHKYRHDRPDLIVSVTSLPIDLLRRSSEPLWPDVPIVFNAIADDELQQRGRPANSTGVVHRWHLRETAAVIRQLFPEIRRIVAPFGPSALDLGYREVVRAGLQDTSGLAYEEWNEPTIERLRQRIQHAPEDAAIFLLVVSGDRATPSLTPYETVQDLARASNRPVFGGFSHHVGTGIVGGVMVDPFAVGYQTGELTARLLQGEQADAVPLTIAASRPVFDARQLRRYGVTTAALPANSELLFDDVPVFERYRWPILGTLGVVAVQAVSIGVLLQQRRRRLKAEAEQRAHMQEMAHLDRVASLGALATSLAHELNQPLTAILMNAQVAQLLLERSDGASSEELREALADIVEDDRRASDIIVGMRRFLKKGEIEAGPVDLNGLCRDTVRLVAPRALDKRVTISSALSTEPAFVHGDAVQLQQVIVNFVVNAIDASGVRETGPRRVVVASQHEGAEVRLAVHDSGGGVAPADMALIFRPFVSTKADGLGMGLSISRTIVEAHRGRIWVENDESGAVFQFALPAVGQIGSGTKGP